MLCRCYGLVSFSSSSLEWRIAALYLKNVVKGNHMEGFGPHMRQLITTKAIQVSYFTALVIMNFVSHVFLFWKSWELDSHHRFMFMLIFHPKYISILLGIMSISALMSTLFKLDFICSLFLHFQTYFHLNIKIVIPQQANCWCAVTCKLVN